MKKRFKRNRWWITGSIFWFLVFGTIFVYVYDSNGYPEDFPSYPAITDDEWERLGVDPPPSTFSPKQTIKYWAESQAESHPDIIIPPPTLSPLQQSLKDLYSEEFETIMEAARENDCTEPELLSILFAIRTAENGRAGIEFGVLNPKAVDQPNSLRVQAGWCAATVSKNHKRWIDSGENVDFITFLGNRYCPVGADNDPNGLNKHWIPNVRKIAERNLDAMYK